MKKWKYVRNVLSRVGYTTYESTEGLIINGLDEDYYLYFTDAGGNRFKARYDGDAILIDSDTIIITVGSVHNMNTGDTQQILVTNEDNVDVINECVFNVPSEFNGLISVNSTGLITAVETGSTLYVEITHNDYDLFLNPGASGTTSTFDIT